MLRTIDPGISANHCALRQLQGLNCGQDIFVLQSLLFHFQDFLGIGWTVYICAEEKVVIDRSCGQIDNAFVEFILKKECE